MKTQKKVELIESAIKLFAQKGFHFTSVQDIVDDCTISKGAFYNYFDSKEALHVAIFQYYFEQINTRLLEIDQLYDNPRDKLIQQIKAPFEHTKEQRKFFVIFLREQSFSINKELQQFIEKIKVETVQRYGRFLKEMYGEKVTPYLSDLILLIEGLTNSYLVSTLFHGLTININQLPTFILQQIDDAVNNFFSIESPIVQDDFALDILSNGFFTPINEGHKSISLLNEMLEQLEVMELEEETRSSYLSVIDYLKNALESEQIEPLMFQGMLANLKDIPEFDPYREKIATLMNVQLL